MSRKYKFSNKESLYFITFTVVDWIDVFIRNEYKDVLIDSWKYCQKNKGLIIHAWVIMTNHVHMIISSNKMELWTIMRDMKSFTSTTLKEVINNNPHESRKKWMMEMFHDAGLYKNNNNTFQFWQQHNHPILLDSKFLLEQKLDYIHNNPVKQGIVDEPDYYTYSSARDYFGETGLINIELIE